MGTVVIDEGEDMTEFDHVDCVFCGAECNFLCTLKNVCLSCGDKLQKQGIIVLSTERFNEIEKELLLIRSSLAVFENASERKVRPQSTEPVRVTTAKFNEKHEESAYVPDQPYWRED